ncbi:MAG: glycosyltransferase family 4 protein [Steroidobacteraceae bacterium]|nr:glycosyltransferase family 4 protein [Steroidobacteraceae bacterium]
MSVRTLLIVSYHFAPSPAVGAKRFSFLAREFEALGYDVHVIANESGDSPHGPPDASLPHAGSVHRVRAPLELPLRSRGFAARKVNSVAHRVLAPLGLEYFWAGAATRKALEVARGLPPGVVIATSPPHAALIAGHAIARALGWPLLIDYRDPWSGYDWPAWRRGAFTNSLARRAERPIVAASAARILNTPAMRTAFEAHFPDAPSARNLVIPNGFDPVPAGPAPSPAGPINLVHAGEIFSGRSLVPVLLAAQRLSARFADRPIRVTTYGALPAPEATRIREAGLESFVDVRPRVPFAELFGELQAAHALLAVVGDHMLYSTPYKVYDYMAAGRPILGLAPRGASLFGLLSESGAGVCVEPGDVEAIERTLEKMVISPAGEGAVTRVERYRWSNLALQYRIAIETVAGGAVAPAHVDAMPARKAS